MQGYIGWFLSALALGLFFPGILLPMFSLDMDMMINVTGTSVNTELVSQELSIIGTVEKLLSDKRYLVGALIFLFSVIIPLLKSTIMIVAASIKNKALAHRLLSFITLVGKWSMADVFVVAIFLAVMSTQHADTITAQSFSLFGFTLDVKISTQMLSAVGEGFYYFVGYCTASLLGSQLVFRHHRSKNTDNLKQF